jgi:hypothetical protein
MKGVLANSALLGEAVGGERAVDGLDDLTAVAKVFQSNLSAVGDCPSSRLELSGQTVTFQVLNPADHQIAVFAHEPGHSF